MKKDLLKLARLDDIRLFYIIELVDIDHDMTLTLMHFPKMKIVTMFLNSRTILM
jgi:hypothetical protein